MACVELLQDGDVNENIYVDWLVCGLIELT